jgi:hypothetical protein
MPASGGSTASEFNLCAMRFCLMIQRHVGMCQLPWVDRFYGIQGGYQIGQTLPPPAILPSFSCPSLGVCWGGMPKPRARKAKSRKTVTRDDLLRLVVEPLSRQTNLAWQHTFEKIQELQETVDIIARQIARQEK